MLSLAHGQKQTLTMYVNYSRLKTIGQETLGPVTPPPRNEKRETRKLSSNQKSAAHRFYFSERENLDDFQNRQPTDFLPPR